MKNEKLIIHGMTCASCAKINENNINNLKGIKSANVNIANKKADIEFDETLISIDEIIVAIKNSGYEAEIYNKDQNLKNEKNNKEIKQSFRRFLYSAIFAIPVFSMMFFELRIGIKFLGIDLSMRFYSGLTFIVVYILGFHFHKSAFKNLKHLNFNMDSLISLGTNAAFLYSIWAMFNTQFVYFEAAVGIITLINLGKYFEALSKGKASNALEKLIQLGVKQARLIIAKDERMVEIDQLKIGDTILIKAGEKVPIDGKILLGTASVDESMLTGESLPVEKEIGDNCFGGTINLNGLIHLEVTKISQDTILSKIVKMVEQAQGSKAPIQKLADSISGYFVPAVIVFAIITFVLWYIISNDFAQSIVPAVAVLVIACPCALGLATPTAIMVGTGVGAQKGILIKNGETLEKSNHIDIVLFDKTGTLTEGKPKVTDVVNFDISENDLLELTYSLSNLSNHPLSIAIADYCKSRNINLQQMDNYKELSGMGIKANTKNMKQELLIGNIKLLKDNGINILVKNQQTVDKLSIEGKTPILIAYGEKIIGILGLMDNAKPDSVNAVSRLIDMGIDVFMISGDNKTTSQAIAKHLGINNVIAEVMPQDKANYIKKLQLEGKCVAFVGDGLNDAPALAQADLGIAIGTGTDIAIETGNIVLMKGNPNKVVDAIKLSQKTFGIIKQNLFWAFFYNIIGIPLAALGLLNPIFAGFAMSMSSVSVVLNSLRIKKF